MAHNLEFFEETAADAVFKCRDCGAIIGFNKPGIGEPSAIALEGGGWAHPERPEQWMTDCTAG